VVKYGLIRDAAFFEWLEANGRAVLGGDPGAQAVAIRRSLEVKAAIVAADERETGTSGRCSTSATPSPTPTRRWPATAAGSCTARR
jgi:hypothetical protein